MTTTRLSDQAIDDLHKVSSAIRGIADAARQGLGPVEAVTAADMFRRQAKWLVSLADSLDPWRVSIVVVDIQAAIQSAATQALLAGLSERVPAQEIAPANPCPLRATPSDTVPVEMVGDQFASG
jgi:hypothetical protein